MNAVLLPWCDFPHTVPRQATVLFDGEFHCSLCAEVLVGEKPALALARIELADPLIDAIDRGERLI